MTLLLQPERPWPARNAALPNEASGQAPGRGVVPADPPRSRRTDVPAETVVTPFLSVTPCEDSLTIADGALT